MKCVFVSAVDVDPAKVPLEEKAKIQFRLNKVGPAGRMKPIPYFPAGTEYDHPDAHTFVRLGMAAPADDECRDMVSDLSPEQLEELQLKHRRNAAGILKEDAELFDSGVISGYEKDGTYKPGPNWAAYQKTLAEAAAKNEQPEI